MSDLAQLTLELLANRPLFCRKDLQARYGKSAATIDRWHSDGTLPKAKHFHGPMWTPAQIAKAEKQNQKLKKI